VKKVKADSNFGEIYGFGFHPHFFTPFCLIKKVSKKSRLPDSFPIFYSLLTHAQQQLDPLRGSQTFAAQGLSQAHKP
jgi:hypothetical protein